jgi:small subunit ribosomal protein S2
MRRYIFGERDGIYIIDLMQTVDLLARAMAFAEDLASKGGVILFVGTKKQAKDTIKAVAQDNGMLYVNERWLGGLLTNFNTMRKRIERLHELRALSSEGRLELLPTKERMSMEAELQKLEANLSGVADMQHLPNALFVTDLKVEEIGVREAARLNIPTIGLVDTNCDPAQVDYVIPGNDDAIRSNDVIIKAIGGAAAEGRSRWLRQEQARREAEEAERRAAEERQRREEEERRAREAAAEEARKQAEEARAEAQAAPAESTPGEQEAAQAEEQPQPEQVGNGQ